MSDELTTPVVSPGPKDHTVLKPFDSLKEDNSTKPRRMSDLFHRLWLAWRRDPQVLERIERSVAHVERQDAAVPCLRPSTDADALEAMGVDEQTVRILLVLSDTLITVVDEHDIVRFMGGTACPSLGRSSCEFLHEHLGMVVVHLGEHGSLAYLRAVRQARREGGQLRRVIDEEWAHNARTYEDLTLVMSTHRRDRESLLR